MKPCCGDTTQIHRTINRPARARTTDAASITHWPAWARAIRRWRTDEDVGVGDTVHRIIGDVNGEKFSKWFQIVFKRDCGCPRRRAEWNEEYPYSNNVAQARPATKTTQDKAFQKTENEGN